MYFLYTYLILGIIPLRGHFPLSSDPIFHQSLTIGPLTRYAEDLKLLANVIGGEDIQQLNLNEKVELISKLSSFINMLLIL